MDLPQNQPLTVRVDTGTIESKTEAPFDDLARLAEKLAQYPTDPDSPGDRAAQHDHYLYGTPKRPKP